MKRLIFAALSFVCILSQCSSNNVPEAPVFEDLKTAADQYSLEDAKKAGYVIIENGNVSSGEDSWEEFVSQTGKDTPAKIRVVHYYTLHDPSHYDPQYYVSIKDDYPKMYIFDLEFDGEKYTERHYEGSKLYEHEYKYLMRYEGEAETPYATYSSYVRYVLVNDNTVTWKDITFEMFSSSSVEITPHSQIYTDLND